MALMRIIIDIDPALLAQARQVSGQAAKKQIIESALRLWIKLQRQREVDAAFGKYRWRGNLARGRKRRGASIEGADIADA
jgi:Arc/MetJ family transcription regulator